MTSYAGGHWSSLYASPSCLGCGSWVWGLGVGVQDVGVELGVWGLGVGVQGGWVRSVGVGVWGSGFRVWVV